MDKNLNYGEIKIKGKLISSSWWGQKWCKNIESYQKISNRLERGRTYIRNDCIKSFEVSDGRVYSTVKGSDNNFYNVIISIDKINSKQYKHILKKCENSISNIESLMTGQFPDELQDLLSNNEYGLFPKVEEINYSCECKDFEQNNHVCKNIAATLYGIGNKLDEDPTIFFILRGINLEEFSLMVLKHERDYIWKNINENTKRRVYDNDVEKLFGISPQINEDFETINVLDGNKTCKEKTNEKRNSISLSKKQNFDVKSDHNLKKSKNVKLVEIKCKNCGAKLEIGDSERDYYCEFCHSSYKLDDGIQHIKYDNMEQAGYEFEKGKIKARQEEKERREMLSSSNINVPQNGNNKSTFSYLSYLFIPSGSPWWIELIWICLKIIFLPFVLTFAIACNKRMKWQLRMVFIVLIWIIVFIFLGTNNQENYDTTDTNNKTQINSKTQNNDSYDSASEDKKVYRTNSEDYFDMVNTIGNAEAEKYVFLKFNSTRSVRTTFFELYFTPTKIIEKNEMEIYAKEITENIFNELIKYDYENPSIFVQYYDEIRINFRYYDPTIYNKTNEKCIYIIVKELSKYNYFDDFYQKYK